MNDNHQNQPAEHSAVGAAVWPGLTRVGSGCLGLALLALIAGPLSSCGARTELPTGDLEVVEPPDPTECSTRHDLDRLRFGSTTQMDLLFMIDNSLSMADKQLVLRQAVPSLVSRLANPLCLSLQDPGVSQPRASAESPCPEGFQSEFEPVTDLHIGVVTSSLGAHGGEACSFDAPGLDDRAHLVGSLPRGRGVPSYSGLGFLAWDPTGVKVPPGENDLATFERNFQDLLTQTADQGCGFEASLESWYRFLIDPEPPERVERGPCPGAGGECTVPVGVDQVLLEQRRRFLRPDSLLMVVMLSDENDCSLRDEGQVFLMTTASRRLPRATSICADRPNDPCCHSCNTPVVGCPSPETDPECQRGLYSELEDQANLRCFQQRRRFGVDFLYPTSRYVVGLTETTLCPDSVYGDADCACRAAIESARGSGFMPPCTERETGAPIENPLYSAGRSRADVFLAGIVGVPWQDLATPESLDDSAPLEFLTAAELAETDPELGMSRWELILGGAEAGAPGDPLMMESIDARSGIHPLTGEALVPPGSEDPRAHSINGHERVIARRHDLQYACIFELEQPRDCSGASIGCDCAQGPPETSTNPLCQPPEGGAGETTQFFAKAYPSIRQLEVLRDFGERSIVASICPKTSRGSELELGYRPAVSGLLERLRCNDVDREIVSDPEVPEFGQLPCTLINVQRAGPCDCTGSTRKTPPAELDESVRAALEQAGFCGGAQGVSCDALCICESLQTTGEARVLCQNDASETPRFAETGELVEGWCYVDPSRGFGSPELVRGCPAGSARNVRVLGSALPAPDETAFVACPKQECEEP